MSSAEIVDLDSATLLPDVEAAIAASAEQGLPTNRQRSRRRCRARWSRPRILEAADVPPRVGGSSHRARRRTDRAGRLGRRRDGGRGPRGDRGVAGGTARQDAGRLRGALGHRRAAAPPDVAGPLRHPGPPPRQRPRQAAVRPWPAAQHRGSPDRARGGDNRPPGVRGGRAAVLVRPRDVDLDERPLHKRGIEQLPCLATVVCPASSTVVQSGRIPTLVGAVVDRRLLPRRRRVMTSVSTSWRSPTSTVQRGHGRWIAWATGSSWPRTSAPSSGGSWRDVTIR